MKFGRLLNMIFSPIILGFIFFIIILPTNLIMKCLRKDFLEKKYGKSYNTYWKKKDNLIDFNNQF